MVDPFELLKTMMAHDLGLEKLEALALVGSQLDSWKRAQQMMVVVEWQLEMDLFG